MKEAWDVFQEDASWSYLANQSEDERPEPSVVSGSFSVAGDAPRLAGESC
jgi:hypothetical protein